MMQSVCVRILVLCLALLVSVSGVNSSRQFYVRPTSDPTSVCPGKPCFTLDQYVENSDTYITSNTVFKLLPGQHDLIQPFVAQTIENITIEGQLEAKLTVIQLQNFIHSNPSSAALQFFNSSSVTVVAVKIVVSGQLGGQLGAGVFVHHGCDIFITSVIIEVGTLQQLPPSVISIRHNRVVSKRGIAVDESTNITLVNINISDSHFGVFVHNSSNVQLSKMNVSNSSTAISINGTDNVICTNISVSDCDWAGIELFNDSGIAITNTTICNATTYGIRTSQISHVSIQSTLMNNVGTGIVMDSTKNIEIYNITISNVRRIGLHLRHSNQIVITDSNIDNVDRHGLYLQDTDNVLVSHTSISNITRHGIHLKFTEGTLISNTSIFNVGQCGVYTIYNMDTKVLYTSVSNSDYGIRLLHAENTTLLL